MKGYKDENGWWHHPKPPLEDFTYWSCPNCGSWDTESDDGAGDHGYYNSWLADQWQDKPNCPPSETFTHAYVCVECNQCGYSEESFNTFYWDADQERFMHGEPMLPEEAQRAEYEDMLRREREAGQLSLPMNLS